MAKYFGCVVVQRVVFPAFLAACKYSICWWTCPYVAQRSWLWIRRELSHLTCSTEGEGSDWKYLASGSISTKFFPLYWSIDGGGVKIEEEQGIVNRYSDLSGDSRRKWNVESCYVLYWGAETKGREDPVLIYIYIVGGETKGQAKQIQSLTLNAKFRCGLLSINTVRRSVAQRSVCPWPMGRHIEHWDCDLQIHIFEMEMIICKAEWLMTLTHPFGYQS